ncbi:MAG: OmpH family outer membrane protein [Alphaproteobacteria bacterium]
MNGRAWLVALLAGVAVTLGSATVRAQSLPPSVIAVVDFEGIVRNSSAGQSLRKQVAQQREAFQAEVAIEEDKLRAEEQDLKAQESELEPSAFADKVRAFESRVAEVQRLVQARKQSLDRALGTGEETIRQATIAILDDFAKQRGFNIVLPLRQVLLVESTYNLTDDVLAELNRRLPDVAVEFGAE